MSSMTLLHMDNDGSSDASKWANILTIDYWGKGIWITVGTKWIYRKQHYNYPYTMLTNTWYKITYVIRLDGKVELWINDKYRRSWTGESTYSVKSTEHRKVNYIGRWIRASQSRPVQATIAFVNF